MWGRVKRVSIFPLTVGWIMSSEGQELEIVRIGKQLEKLANSDTPVRLRSAWGSVEKPIYNRLRVRVDWGLLEMRRACLSCVWVLYLVRKACTA